MNLFSRMRWPSQASRGWSAVFFVLGFSSFYLAATPGISAQAASDFVVGVNLPWIKYGLDFGASGFGHFGLSTDSSEGFRPQRDPDFPETHGVVKCERSKNRVREGEFSLRLWVDISGGDPNRPTSGEVATDLQDIAQVAPDYTIDLTGHTVSAWVYVPPGQGGEAQHPNFLQLFVKDASDGALGQFGATTNIPAEGGWRRLEMKVEKDDTEFDPARIRILGVKVGIGGGSEAAFTESLFVDQYDTTVPGVSFGFEEPSRAAIDAGLLTGSGAMALRWFVFADGRAAPEFDDAGFVTGLDSEFLDDFETLLELARGHGFLVIPVLFDFLLCGDRRERDGVPLFGHADLIRDPARRQSLIDNALDPLLDRFGAAPEILAWEIVNEPEWCLSDLDLASRPREIPPAGAVTATEFQDFVTAVARAIRDHAATGDPLVTVGSASFRYLDLWQETGADLCQFHFYNCPDCIDAGMSLPHDGECLIGEFAALRPLAGRTVFEFLADSCAARQLGALPWSWRARDRFSPQGWAPQLALLRELESYHYVGTPLCQLRRWLGPTPPPPSIDPEIVIEAPLEAEVGLTVTFRWQLISPEPGEVYRYEVRLDKGADACDNFIEEAFDAGAETCLRTTLSQARLANAHVGFAIRATDSKGGVFCTRGQRFFVDPDLPASAPCP